MRELRAQGLGIVFVTHRLDEVLQICDRATVLRDGRLVGTRDVAEVTVDDLIRMMVGRSAAELFTPLPARDGRRGRARGRGHHPARQPARDRGATVLDGVSLSVRRGEILGLAGLMGSGRTELARAIFGADRIERGEIRVDGHAGQDRLARGRDPAGIGLVPEDRKQQALFLALAVRTNLSLAALGRLSRRFGWIDERAEEDLVERYRESLNIRMAGSDQLVGNLSGGNQQKVVLARWLALRPKILIVDEPTRGIDVAAKAEVHQLLDRLAQERHRDPRDQLGIARDPGDRRPHRDDARRARHRRDRPRGGERGAADADDDARAGARHERAHARRGCADPQALSICCMLLGRFAPVIFLLVLMLVFALLEPRFLHPLNLFNVMRQISITGLLAIGMTFVILTAGIDLSVGSLLALCGPRRRRGRQGRARGPLRRGRGAGGRGLRLVLGDGGGDRGRAGGRPLQGTAITRLKVPPFVVTLGGLSAFRGAALLFAGGGPISGFDEAYPLVGPGQDRRRCRCR